MDRIETRSSGFLRCVKSRVSDPKTTLNPPDQADCCFDFGRFASFLHLDRIETRTFAFLCSMKSRVSHVFPVGSTIEQFSVVFRCITSGGLRGETTVDSSDLKFQSTILPDPHF